MKKSSVLILLPALMIVLSGCSNNAMRDGNQTTTANGIGSIPEINEPNMPAAKNESGSEVKNDCEAACNKYVMACLTLVPNASEALFIDGLNSCLGECVKWDKKKVDCMIAVMDCSSMTEVCGL